MSVLQQTPKTVIEEKPQETIFAVVDTTDIENPTLTTSLRIPYSINPDNNVVIDANHAYVTTENHLHTIDVSTPQQPVYLKSLEFENQIGKVVVFKSLLVVGSKNELHFIDITEPSKPILHVTKHLTNRNPIIDFDVWDTFLYVMGENNMLYVFTRGDEQPKHIRTAKLSDRWRFIYPKNASQMVEQVKYPLRGTSGHPHELTQGLLTDRYFMQIRNSKDGSVRSSSAFVGVAKLDTSTDHITVYNAGYNQRGDRPHHTRTGSILVNIHRDYLDYLSSQTELTTTNRNSDDANEREETTNLQQFKPVFSNGTMNYKDKQFMGSITDFQISGNLLYVLNAKGYLSILWLLSVEDELSTYRPEFLSLTSLQGNHPKRLVVGENYVYLIATPKNSQQ